MWRDMGHPKCSRVRHYSLSITINTDNTDSVAVSALSIEQQKYVYSHFRKSLKFYLHPNLNLLNDFFKKWNQVSNSNGSFYNQAFCHNPVRICSFETQMQGTYKGTWKVCFLQNHYFHRSRHLSLHRKHFMQSSTTALNLSRGISGSSGHWDAAQEPRRNNTNCVWSEGRNREITWHNMAGSAGTSQNHQEFNSGLINSWLLSVTGSFIIDPASSYMPSHEGCGPWSKVGSRPQTRYSSNIHWVNPIMLICQNPLLP